MAEETQFTEEISLILVDSLICSFNLIGNAMVILCFALSKKCRSIIGYLLVQLAICDISAVLRLFLDSLDIALGAWYPDTDLFFNRDWLCSILANIFLFGFHLQSLTLCGIAINRYIRITKSHLYCKYVDNKAHVWTLVLVWIFATLFHSEGFFINDGQPRVSNYTANFGKQSFDYDVCTIGGSIKTRYISTGALFFIAGYCYGGIFKYFILTHREVQSASTKGAIVPSVWEKSKNMALHILTLLFFYLSMIGATILSRVWNWRYAKMVSTASYLSNSSINLFLTLVFVNDFNIAVKAILKCRLPATMDRKYMTKKLQTNNKVEADTNV